ncbi:ABC transporter permease [Williamsoniiplasma luminosum]|uniref:ABC transporter permease n=1 Tax=Williamsoniiplasma luminosum TaxID=214888 RepID=A0A2K8NT74_9MOLU|nr:ABC transporter permease [Williamsoniiplasma luminosum]ATZ17040.1 ABC transporter permease [Williamsoniiplasma luminosum]
MKGQFLIFKSGFKGIFKYKIQLLIIITLSFFATFFLMSTDSFISRLNQTYNDVVANVEKYDYEYERKFNKSSFATDNLAFVPLLDFVNTDYNEIQNDGNTTTQLNFNLSSFDGNDNFITKTFSSPEFMDVYKEQLFSHEDQNYLGYYGVYYNHDPESGDKEFILPEITYDFGKNYENFAFRSRYNDEFSPRLKKYIEPAIELLTKNFKSEYLKNLTNEKTNMQNTLFYKTLVKYGVNENNFNQIISSKYANVNESNITNKISEKDLFLGLNTYLYNAFESLIQYTIYQTAQLALEIRNQFESEHLTNDPKLLNPKFYVDAFNKKFFVENDLDELPKFKLIKHFYDREFALDQYAVTAYEYIFGKKYQFKNNEPNDIKHNEQYIVNDENPTYSKEIRIGEDNSDSNKFANDVYKKGLRGQTNPLKAIENENEEIIGASQVATTKVWEKLRDNKTLLSQANGLSGNYNDWKIENRNLFSMDYLHQKMAADLVDIDLYLRQEAFMYDVSTKKSFRFAILDQDFDYNFKMIAGLEPMTASEIVISQQFALKNNIKIGQKLNIGKSQFIVSGFGSDSLSYYPITDLQLPTTDIQNSAIVYVNKETLNLIANNGNADDLTWSNYFFIKDKKTPKTLKSETETLKQKITSYNGWLFTDPTKLNINTSIINKNPLQLSLEDANQINRIVDFNKTNFILNWSLQPSIVKTLNIFVYVVSVIILMMVVISLIVTIKKSIDNNSKQIGYLKSMGYKSREIALSYTGYGIVIALIVVPLAFVASGFFQEVISIMFSSYFATTLYEFRFNPKMLGVAFVAFGIVSTLISYLIAYFYTRKDILKLFHSTDNHKVMKYNESNSLHVVFNKLSFNVRFASKISTRGWKQVSMILIGIFVSTFVVTLATAIPSIMNNYIKDANQYLKYKNSYRLESPISNMPLTKKAISANHGITRTEQVYSQLPKEIKDSQLTYYDDYRYYNDGNNNTSLFAPLIYNGSGKEFDSSKLNWSEEHVYKKALESQNEIKNDGLTDTSGFLGFLTNSVANGLFNLNGVNISLGSFEKFMGYLMHSQINPQTNQKFESFEKRKEMIDKTNAIFKGLIPTLLGMLSGDLNLGEIPTDDWKEAVIQLIFTFIPNSGQKYLKDSENRKSQFTFGSGYETYTPNQETLSTNIKFAYDNGDENIDIIGLKENQSAFNIKKYNLNNTLLDAKVLKQLQDVIDGNIEPRDIKTSTGFELYNAKTKTLSIPVASNLQSDRTFNLDRQDLADVKFETSKLIYTPKKQISNTNEENIVPANAWIYDDRDWSSINKNEKNEKNEWLKAADLDVNKINYSLSIDEKGLVQEAPMFAQASVNENGELVSEIRPFYSYNNLKLFFPKNKVDMETYTLGLEKAALARKNEDSSKWINNISTWYGDVKQKDVPEIVKKAWNEDGDYFYIAPYSLQYYANYSQGLHGKTDIKTIGDGVAPWIHYGFGRDSKPLHLKNVKTLPKNINQINVKKTSTIDSYNSDLVVADQDLINLIYGYSNNKYIPLTYNGFGQKITNTEETEISMYENISVQDYFSKPTNELLFANDELKEQGLDPLKTLTQNSWFNNKYSNFTELIGVTTGVKFGNNEKPGINIISKIFDKWKDPSDALKLAYSDIQLASSKLGIVVTVTETILAFSVFIISGIIIIATLIITVITDIFVMRYQRFMTVMKAMGYSKWYIIKSSIGITFIVNLMAIGLGILTGIMFAKSLLHLASNLGILIPYVLDLWIIPLIIGIILITFTISIIISLRKPLSEKPTVLFG